MAITPRSKGLGNIGAIVDRQGRASVAAPKAPVKPVVKAAPRPAPRPAPKPVARVAPKPAPKMAPVSKPSPFAKKPDTRAPGGGGMDVNGNPIGGGMGAQMNIARPGQGNLARNTGPGNGGPQLIGGAFGKPIFGGPPTGGPIDYLAELNKDAGWGTGTGQGDFTPNKRMDDASENYFKSVIDAAGGYDQYKAKNPGKDVFTINQDFERMNPEQKYGYLSYISADDSPSNRAPVGTPPPQSIYDQFGIPPNDMLNEQPYMPPPMGQAGFPTDDQGNFIYPDYNSPSPMDPFLGGPYTPRYDNMPRPDMGGGYYPQEAGISNYSMGPDGNMQGYSTFSNKPNFNYGGMFGQQPGRINEAFYPGEIEQLQQQGFGGTGQQLAQLGQQGNNFGGGGFMGGGSGSLFGGGGFAGK